MKSILSLAVITMLPFAGAGAQQTLPQVKVDVKQGTGAVELTLAGTMDYTPADAPYKVELSGTVSATTCAVQ